MSIPPRLYVDSADVERVSELLVGGLVAGVTTNPTILERSGRRVGEIADLYTRWVEEGAEEVFFQTWGSDALELLAHAERIRALGDRVVVKVPATREGFIATRRLLADGATVLVTAVYSPAQALACASYGVQYIAPYLGRLRDAGRDGANLIARMQGVCAGSDTNVIAASLRSPDDIVELRELGVPYFTAHPDVILGLLQDDTSDAAAAEFDAAVSRIP